MYLKFNGLTMFLICFFVLSILTIFGCEHNVDESESQKGENLSFVKILNDVFVSCSSCHLDGASNGGLDLSDYENIVSAASTQKPDLMLIKPSDPDSSYLYMKITGAEGIIGYNMPPSGKISGDQLNLLRDWILAGAPEINTK